MAKMVVTCQACQTKFRVDETKIGARGVKVRCSKCQTMIIVQPEPPTPVPDDRPPDSPPVVPTPPVLGTEEQRGEATRVMQAPLVSQLMQEASGAPPVPPLSTSPPSLDTPIGTQEPPGAWQTSPPAPPPAEPPLGEDLFSDPFANHPQSPPTGSEDLPQRFADLQPSDGPSLELDLPVKHNAPPPDDPLAGMPKFEDTVTKPTPAAQEAPPTTVVAPARVEDMQMSKPSAAPPSGKRKSGTSHKTIAFIGYVAIALIVVVGLFGEYMLFRAGGYEGLVSQADRLSEPSNFGVELHRVKVAPYLSADGRPFIIVRGELYNKSGQPSPPFAIDVALGAERVASVQPGAMLDVAVLYRDGKIEQKVAPHSTIAPNEMKPFTVAIAAPKDLSTLQDELTFSLRANASN
jgi:predicted Zn finger-like uncharacterized protein